MNLFQSLTEYLRDSKSELEKVTWPTRRDTIRYTSLVLAVSIIVAAFFATLDYGLDAVVSAALSGRSTTQTDIPPQQVPNEPSNVNVTSVLPGLDVQTSSSTVFEVTSTTPTPPQQ